MAKSNIQTTNIKPDFISADYIKRISDALVGDVGIFKKIRTNVDYVKIGWDSIDMKNIFADSIESWEYKYFRAHMDEQLYIRSFLKFYSNIYNIYFGEGKRFHFLTKAGADRIYNIFKKKYFDNFMDIIYNKYKNENVNYFATSVYKEALEVISSTFITDKLKYFTEINLAEMLQDWLYLDIRGKHYNPHTDQYIKVKNCKDLFLETCNNNYNKERAKECLKDFSNSWRSFITTGKLNPLLELIAKVFFIAVFNAMLDRTEYEGSELSWKIRCMEKNFYATHGCAVREHAQKSLLSFVEDAKKYKYSHDHAIIGSHFEDTDDYSLFDCFIAPIICDEKRIELTDRYKPSQSEHRIAKLMAPYQVMFSKISTMESQILFALNSIHNTKNLSNVVDGRKEPLILNVELMESNDFYKNKCFVKTNLEDIQLLINDITKKYALLYDHSSWSFTNEINELLKKFHEENPKVADDPNTMINIYNALKTIIGSYEEYLYKHIRNPIAHIYDQFSNYPYTMDLSDPKTSWADVMHYTNQNMISFKNYLSDEDKKGFIDFLQNSAKIFDENDESWSCYDTLFVPIIDIFSDNAKTIINQINDINEGFAKFEKLVCKWYMVMMNRSKYISEFNINEYKKFINESRISILQSRISEFL